MLEPRPKELIDTRTESIQNWYQRISEKQRQYNPKVQKCLVLKVSTPATNLLDLAL